MKWTTSGVPGILEEVARQGAFMTVNAPFDGRAIIPDEPLDMPLDQALIVQIERVGPREPVEESALAGAQELVHILSGAYGIVPAPEHFVGSEVELTHFRV